MKKYVLVLILIPLFYFPCYISNDLLLDLTKEDGVYEYAGALLFLLTAIAFFILATRPKYYTAYNNTKKYPERKYFWLFALLFFFAFGEEISWGQRIFNFETPEAIKENNIQEEFNLHNLEVFHGKTTEGEDKTGIMALFTMHRLFYLAFLTYLLILPILYYLSAKFKSFIDKIKLPVPNIWFGVLFALNLVYGNALRALSSGIDGHSTVEIKEFVIAFILFILPLSWLSLKKSKKNLQS
ncbi:MAG: hypothetical protein ACR2MT_11150 [Aurantibacter sp.]